MRLRRDGGVQWRRSRADGNRCAYDWVASRPGAQPPAAAAGVSCVVALSRCLGLDAGADRRGHRSRKPEL